MTRDEFLTELHDRGYPRDQVFLLPGPDERRDPDGGGVVVRAPHGDEPRWLTYQLDRGVKHEARFEREDEVYDFVLATHFPPRPGTAGPATRADFLAELERRGGRASWVAFRDHTDDPAGREGQFVVDTTGGTVLTYRLDGGRRDERTVDTEAAAWRAVLNSLPGGRR